MLDIRIGAVAKPADRELILSLDLQTGDLHVAHHAFIAPEEYIAPHEIDAFFAIGMNHLKIFQVAERAIQFAKINVVVKLGDPKNLDHHFFLVLRIDIAEHEGLVLSSGWEIASWLGLPLAQLLVAHLGELHV